MWYDGSAAQGVSFGLDLVSSSSSTSTTRAKSKVCGVVRSVEKGSAASQCARVLVLLANGGGAWTHVCVVVSKIENRTGLSKAWLVRDTNTTTYLYCICTVAPRTDSQLV